MPSDTLVLGFDTSAAHCAAALLCGDRIVAIRAEEMSRGQAERLMPLLQEVLAAGGADWRDLAALGVGIGPGNFTGIRIAVSAARGLALGLGVPAIGVTGFEARAALAPAGHLPAIPAPREQVYVAPPGREPSLIARADAPSPLFDDAAPGDLACAIARIAATRRHSEAPPPAPLYLRPADAAPSRDVPPMLLDG
ncbi:tRNA threonylcarbamoyl adenosine modification protein YeaZ [Cribrihabitans marinus]|uniref:tRNA threonylcarbamoyl adenosine modification protein YeaZ n=1 Tax=Cribrihabitans marinus TaxID=1227549 RepID=A0A1H7CHN6_9RHOB|nr:tRNA (adenosine(37)-N6)-threonylcarbamoyltransferase complex dimerization subunit type 1 TsaB [Cribrihabitans marinus]GGH35568.1 tRNA N6-adenosine(37)-N6-threonylcarbamoyltransferase complex dimerization subunit TsaB [Cribrihabitans marinus]SEJ89138.1 tRNA threonylcarbamoyl adenosine modification protein YeaZ [Cribrihabitans marinus]